MYTDHFSNIHSRDQAPTHDLLRTSPGDASPPSQPTTTADVLTSTPCNLNATASSLSYHASLPACPAFTNPEESSPGFKLLLAYPIALAILAVVVACLALVLWPPKHLQPYIGDGKGRMWWRQRRERREAAAVDGSRKTGLLPRWHRRRRERSTSRSSLHIISANILTLYGRAGRDPRSSRTRDESDTRDERGRSATRQRARQDSYDQGVPPYSEHWRADTPKNDADGAGAEAPPAYVLPPAYSNDGDVAKPGEAHVRRGSAESGVDTRDVQEQERIRGIVGRHF